MMPSDASALPCTPARVSIPLPSTLPPLVADPVQITQLAAAQHSDTDAFGHYIEIMWDREERPDAELDALVSALAADVVAGVDCTRCANCCRMPIGLEPCDIAPLAEALGLTPDAVVEQVVDRASGPSWGEWAVMRGVPCPLLHSTAHDTGLPDRSLYGAICTIYAHRPGACRAYPALVPDFRWLHEALAADAALCPIIYNLIERLKLTLGWCEDGAGHSSESDSLP